MSSTGTETSLIPDRCRRTQWYPNLSRAQLVHHPRKIKEKPETEPDWDLPGTGARLGAVEAENRTWGGGEEQTEEQQEKPPLRTSIEPGPEEPGPEPAAGSVSKFHQGTVESVPFQELKYFQ